MSNPELQKALQSIDGDELAGAIVRALYLTRDAEEAREHMQEVGQDLPSLARTTEITDKYIKRTNQYGDYAIGFTSGVIAMCSALHEIANKKALSE